MSSRGFASRESKSDSILRASPDRTSGSSTGPRQPTPPRFSGNNFAHDFSQVPLFGTASDSHLQGEGPNSNDETSRKRGSSQAVFSFQTFIPDKYVPGTGGFGYGDNRGFGKPGDNYRTFQQITVEMDQSRNQLGATGPAVAKTSESETRLPLFSGKASTGPLHMEAKRRDSHSVAVAFNASIQNGALVVGHLTPAIDFRGAIVVGNAAGKLTYGLSVSHDAFPAYEAFLDEAPIYRWSYPEGNTVLNLLGSGTAVTSTRKTGDAPGGVIGAGRFEGFGGGSGGGGGAGGTY